MRYRGVVVPVPLLTELVRMPVATGAQIPLTYYSSIGSWPVTARSGVDWHDVDEFPGVFVMGGTSFVGKRVIGACRSR